MMIIEKSIDEKLFRLLVSSIKDYAIFLIDANGYILTWNEGAEHIKGYTADEAIGKHISIFYNPEDVNRVELRNNLNEALKNGMHESEGWRIRKDGSRFWANVIFTTLYNDKGHLVGFAKITRDITKRKNMEDRETAEKAELEHRVKENTDTIAANELRFKLLIENSYDGITLFDQNLKVFYRSPSSERINGWSDMDTGIMELLHPDDVALVQTYYAELVSKPGNVVKFTSRMRHGLGHYIWIESIFTNLLQNPSVEAIVCNFRDVSAQMIAQIERERITADLLKRNKDLEQFAYVVSHNLRAPVANIIGMAQLLPTLEFAQCENMKALASIEEAASQIDKVIMDLNHILETGTEINDKLEKVSLPLLVNEVKLSLGHIIAKYGAEIQIDFTKADELFTLKSHLYSIFQNLITNSIKYKRDDVAPVISISTNIKKGNLCICLKDNGRGINLKQHGRDVFGLYKRFDCTVEGKGMGLFMVKMQTENLGGRIHVKSKVDAGTEFILSFPL
jgi:PAS domain S-box-containing protein